MWSEPAHLGTDGACIHSAILGGDHKDLRPELPVGVVPAPASCGLHALLESSATTHPSKTGNGDGEFTVVDSSVHLQSMHF